MDTTAQSANASVDYQISIIEFLLLKICTLFQLQRLYRIITSEELVSPHHSAREMIDILKGRDFTKLFQKNIKKVSIFQTVYCLVLRSVTEYNAKYSNVSIYPFLHSLYDTV